ncbi:MAG: hypothetical protein ACOYKD_00800 [Anaerolineaceae bacterium]|jgi:hypothetical protein
MSDIMSLLDGLTEHEKRYVMARVDAKSNAAALREIKMSRAWLHGCDVNDLNQRAETIRLDLAQRALTMLKNALPAAAGALVDGLKSDDERIKQAAAKEILDRIMGKPTQRAETITQSEPVTLRVIYEDALD